MKPCEIKDGGYEALTFINPIRLPPPGAEVTMTSVVRDIAVAVNLLIQRENDRTMQEISRDV